MGAIGGGTIRQTRPNKDGVVMWEAVLDVPGRDDKRHQTSKRARTKREARAALATMLIERDKGLIVDRSTVGALMQRWLGTAVKHSVRPTTFAGYAQMVNKHIIPGLGHMKVQKLSAADLRTFYAAMLDSGCGPRTVELCHQRLRQALDMAVDDGMVPRNVALAVTPPRVARREMRVWPREDVQRFVDVAKRSGYGPIWLLLAATGMRRGEALGLRWQDIDWERGVITLRQSIVMLHNTPVVQEMKSRAAMRTNALPPAVLDALREHRRRQNERRLALGAVWRDHGLVFASEVGTPINARNLARDFHILIARAGVPVIRIHDLRHTAVSLALADGADIKAVSQHVGHSRPSITIDVYQHVLPHQRQEVADKLGRAIFGA